MDIQQQIVPGDHGSLIDDLNRMLSSALYFEDLYKRYHWMVTGPHFLPLHELFDQHMETLEQEIDGLAERIRTLGGTPVWNPSEFSKQDILPAPDESLADDLAIAGEAFKMEVAYSRALRSFAEDVEDIATEDLLIEYLRVHEQQAWFLREFIQKVGIESYAGDVMDGS
ncbi:Dps family protein [Salisaeta longa]|uniref:Dps family protein n=1 Tax=Salisaeta longa TaxID=503170 RepID=UPI0004180D78|nr:DNA starvation/stationary phase protection protein [Salisaeta longa]